MSKNQTFVFPCKLTDYHTPCSHKSKSLEYLGQGLKFSSMVLDFWCGAVSAQVVLSLHYEVIKSEQKNIADRGLWLGLGCRLALATCSSNSVIVAVGPHRPIIPLILNCTVVERVIVLTIIIF